MTIDADGNVVPYTQEQLNQTPKFDFNSGGTTQIPQYTQGDDATEYFKNMVNKFIQSKQPTQLTSITGSLGNFAVDPETSVLANTGGGNAFLNALGHGAKGFTESFNKMRQITPETLEASKYLYDMQQKQAEAKAKANTGSGTGQITPAIIRKEANKMTEKLLFGISAEEAMASGDANVWLNYLNKSKKVTPDQFNQVRTLNENSLRTQQGWSESGIAPNVALPDWVYAISEKNKPKPKPKPNIKLEQ